MKLSPALLLIPLLALAPTASIAPAEQAAPPAREQQNAPQQAQPTQPPTEGGPGGGTGAIAVPHQTAPATVAPPPPPPVPKNPPGLGHLSIQVNVPEVTLDVGVILEKTHQFVPNLQKDNFRVYENGQLQTITHFQRVQAPITAVLLLEFAANNWWFINDMQNAAYDFIQQLQPNDYVAVVTYDMHTHILTDFTRNHSVIMNALNSLTIPTWDETNMFDAIYTTLDRLSRVPGRKYVILIGSGLDTFSRITLDKCMEKIRDTPDVTIFTIGTGQLWLLYAEDGGGMMGGPFGMSGPREMNFLQAQNELTTFARMTGGMSFFPRFQTAVPDDIRAINASIRNRYQISYTPTDRKLDGTWRKIQVDLVDAEGRPLRMQDEKHHPLKYEVIARSGYRTRMAVQ